MPTRPSLLSTIPHRSHSPAIQYFWCTYVPKVLSDRPATQYLAAMADKDGQLKANSIKSMCPAHMPVKQFWALTIYDRATFSFILQQLR